MAAAPVQACAAAEVLDAGRQASYLRVMPRRATDSPPLRANARHERHPDRLVAAPLGAREFAKARKGFDWGLAVVLLVLAGGAGAIGWFGYQKYRTDVPQAGDMTVFAPRGTNSVPGQDAADGQGWTPTPEAAPSLEQRDVGGVATHAVPSQTQSRSAPRYDNPNRTLGTLRTTEPPKD
ncbi:hypothetical protein [Zavarzinia sp. CC-PAN008]|uniref:hypothetical protein n=1 Tax=Zavarzinia sp. CC-PAN008 TaxID=3243332 RepID=UPI003F749088